MIEAVSIPGWEPGQHVAVTGQTGSGKTTALTNLVDIRPTEGLVILDSKIDPAFNSMGEIVPELSVRKTAEPLSEGEIVVIRPKAIPTWDEWDNFILELHERSSGLTIMVDEGYMLHDNGRCGPGLMAVLTRGRSRKQSLVLGCQRPAWVSRFCFTEAAHILFMRLRHPDDRRIMAACSGEPDLSDMICEKFKGEWIFPGGMVPFRVSPVQNIEPETITETIGFRFI